MQAWYAYGNYIDEVLLTAPANFWVVTRCYVHDHLYSPAALATGSGTVLERYEYDAYGNPYVLEPNFADDPDGKTDWANPYYFTGRRADFLDGGKLTLQINRHRYYDYYTGRWLTHDPWGYWDSLNLYEYALNSPIMWMDPTGLAATCKKGDKEIRIIYMSDPRISDLRLVGAAGAVIVPGGTEMSDPIRGLKTWLINKFKKVFLPSIVTTALLVVKTSNAAVHFQFKYRARVGFQLRECKCMCRKRIWWTLWTFKKCVVWGWGRPKGMVDNITSGWDGDHWAGKWFTWTGSVDTTIAAGTVALKNQFNATKPAAPTKIRSKLASKYGATLVSTFDGTTPECD
jgi:RHS repeat-associated protein